MRIDAHQHFWDPARHEYPWMAGDAMDPVRRAFTPDDLRPVLRAAEIDGTILVQTISSVAEGSSCSWRPPRTSSPASSAGST